jgi:hypothetical protein
MNKLLAVFAVMLVLLSAGVSAADSKKLDVGVVYVYNEPYGLAGMAQISNNGAKVLSNLHATMMIPELGLIAKTASFKLSSGAGVFKQFGLDSEKAAPGEYYVRVSVGNGDTRRVKYRIITIE